VSREETVDSQSIDQSIRFGNIPLDSLQITVILWNSKTKPSPKHPEVQHQAIKKLKYLNKMASLDLRIT
jgi:hypothetical protein